VTFATDLNARRLDPSLRGVKAYSIEVGENNAWRTVVSETDNFQRWRRHVFEDVTARRLRLVLRNSTLDKGAGVYEIRVYHE